MKSKLKETQHDLEKTRDHIKEVTIRKEASEKEYLSMGIIVDNVNYELKEALVKEKEILNIYNIIKQEVSNKSMDLFMQRNEYNVLQAKILNSLDEEIKDRFVDCYEIDRNRIQIEKELEGIIEEYGLDIIPEEIREELSNKLIDTYWIPKTSLGEMYKVWASKKW